MAPTITTVNPDVLKGPIPTDPSKPGFNVPAQPTQPSNWPVKK